MKISITLPSIYPEALERSLDNIVKATKSSELEIIVVSPFEVLHRNVIWLKDKKRDGCNSAHFEASKVATGDFIAAWADDHLLIDNWDDLIIETFLQREVVINNWPFLLGQRQRVVAQHVGTVFGIYYPYFPVMRTEDIKHIGGWLSPDYKHGFGDPDLALRVWQAGGRAEWMEIPTVDVITEEDNARHRERGQVLDSDMKIFLERWAPHYGAEYDITQLRGFNRDLPLSSFPPGQRSCYRNASFSSGNAHQ
jgi:hypothetical protein